MKKIFSIIITIASIVIPQLVISKDAIQDNISTSTNADVSTNASANTHARTHASINANANDNVSGIESDKEHDLQLLPILLRLEGVGEIYGMAAGLTNISKKDFDLHVGLSGGDVKAGLLSISNYRIGEGVLNYQFANIGELNVDTQYSRSMQAGTVFRQELSGSGHHLGYALPLDRDDWTMQLDLLLTNVSFEEFKDSSGKVIDINMDGLTDTNSKILSAAFNWDNRKQKKFSDGVQIKNALTFTTGREGLSDQGQWNFFVGQHVFVHDDVLISAYVKGSHAFILSEETAYDTDGEIRATLNAQCAVNDADCLVLEESLVAFILASNKYGTANAVGGSAGLRSYSEQFFRGANSWLEGVEIEYRLPAFSVFKNNSRLHLVSFAESAQVNDKVSDLFVDSLHTVGLGLRTYASDLAIRLETSHGENGNAWLFTVGLPY